MEQVKEYLTERMNVLKEDIDRNEKEGYLVVAQRKREQFYELARVWALIEQIEMTEKETL